MYEAFVTQLKNVRKHPNADKLMIAECFTNTVIVGLYSYEGEKVIYFPTDGQLSEEYASINNLIRVKNEDGTIGGGYLDPKKRNIRSMKLRGEMSDGLVMPISSLNKFGDTSSLEIGDTVHMFNGHQIAKKYVPEIKLQSGKARGSVKKTNYIPVQYFQEHIDTKQLAYSLGQFKPGDICQITLKMHGTSGRSALLPETKKNIDGFFGKLLNRIKRKNQKVWKDVCGTRRVILNTDQTSINTQDDFRNKHHQKIIKGLKKGETVYYEIVGYSGENSLIMNECSNKKVSDKQFVKEYGNTTKFTYGCENGQSEIFVYRMTMTNEDGFTMEYSPTQIKERCEQMGLKSVPEFETFLYKDENDLMEKIGKYVEGVDPIGKNHIREGIILRVLNRPSFTVFKHKNNYFKILEGIIKDDGFVDAEEIEDMATN